MCFKTHCRPYHLIKRTKLVSKMSSKTIMMSVLIFFFLQFCECAVFSSSDLCFLSHGGSSETFTINEAVPVGSIIGVLKVSVFSLLISFHFFQRYLRHRILFLCRLVVLYESASWCSLLTNSWWTSDPYSWLVYSHLKLLFSVTDICIPSSRFLLLSILSSFTSIPSSLPI